MRNIPFLLWVLLLVDGVSNEENVSRKEGESVTLPLEPGEINEDDLIQWWFDGQMIANMIKEDKITNTFPGPGDIFKERLKLDDQTGSLTIRNIVAKHAGDYELKIHGKTETSKIFRVTVSVYRSMSKMEGDSFSLSIVKQVGETLWMFGGQVIPTDRLNSEKWRNTVQNKETGILSFTNIRTDQSGVYTVKINTSNSVVLGEFHVTVDPGLSPGAVAGIVVAVLLLVFAAAAAAAGGVIFYHKKNSELRSSSDGAETKESNKPLNSGTVNGEGL